MVHASLDLCLNSDGQSLVVSLPSQSTAMWFNVAEPGRVVFMILIVRGIIWYGLSLFLILLPLATRTAFISIIV